MEDFKSIDMSPTDISGQDFWHLWHLIDSSIRQQIRKKDQLSCCTFCALEIHFSNSHSSLPSAFLWQWIYSRWFLISWAWNVTFCMDYSCYHDSFFFFLAFCVDFLTLELSICSASYMAFWYPNLLRWSYEVIYQSGLEILPPWSRNTPSLYQVGCHC